MTNRPEHDEPAADARKDLQAELAAAERVVAAKLADARITAMLQAALETVEPATGLRVDVDTTGGVVYLRGTVPSAVQREAAERVVRASCPPTIRRIVNEIQVNPAEPPLPHP